MNANPAERLPSDSELLDDIRQGRKEAVEILCGKYDRDLRAIIISFLAKHGCYAPSEHADGIKSEVWICILSKLDRLGDANMFAAWRNAIARNEARNHLRMCITNRRSFLKPSGDSPVPDGGIRHLGKGKEDAELADWLYEGPEHIDPVPITAHFDGEHILLDEAVELEPNARLLVTVLPKDDEREPWLRVSTARLKDAYHGEHDEYGLDSIKELNPEYEGR